MGQGHGRLGWATQSDGHSEVGGAHLELEVAADGQVKRYVLLPMGGADGDLAAQLRTLAGKRAQVTGVEETAAASTYLGGKGLKVFDVKPAA